MKKYSLGLLTWLIAFLLLTACGNMEGKEHVEAWTVIDEVVDVPLVEGNEWVQEEELYEWEEEPKKVTESVPAEKDYQYINKDYTCNSAVLIRMKYNGYQMGDKFWVCKYEDTGENILDAVVNIREYVSCDMELSDYEPTDSKWNVRYLEEKDATKQSLIVTQGGSYDVENDIMIKDYGDGWVLVEDDILGKALYYCTEIENGMPVLDDDKCLCFWAGSEVELTEEKVKEIMDRLTFYEVNKENLLHGKDMHTGEMMDLSSYAYVDDLIGEQLNELGLCVDYRYLGKYQHGGTLSVQHTVPREDGYTNIYEMSIQYLDIPREEYVEADLTSFRNYGKLGNYEIEIGKKGINYCALLSYDGQIVFSIENILSGGDEYYSATEMYVAIAKYIFSEDVSNIGTWKDFMPETKEDFRYAKMSVDSGYELINPGWTDKNTFLFRVDTQAQDSYYVVSCTLPEKCVDTLQLNERGEFESCKGKMWISEYDPNGCCNIEMCCCTERGEIIPYQIVWKEIILEELDLIQDYGNGWMLANSTEDFAHLYFDFNYGSESEAYCLAIPIYIPDEKKGNEEYITKRAELYMNMTGIYEVDQDDMLAGVDLETNQSKDLSPYAYLDDILLGEFMKFGVVVPNHGCIRLWEHKELDCQIGEKEYRIEICDRQKNHVQIDEDDEVFITLKDYDVYQNYDEYSCHFVVDDLAVLFIRRSGSEISSFEETMDDLMTDLFSGYNQ